MTSTGTSRMDMDSLVAVMSNDLENQRSLLQKLLHLATAQRRLIESAEHDSLLALVHERQAIVEELVTVRSSVNDNLESLREQADSLSDENRQSLQRKMDETRELSKQVLAIDTQDVDRLMETRSTCQEKLAGMTHVMNARKGYQHSGQSSPRFADAKG
ncbi:MAG: hypothetical protein P8J89_04275 [Phycisphaerales bacterium]|nr:hypothetical protein [Phycisphaerales bacterium]